MSTAASHVDTGHVPADFFVVRTPLFPLATFRDWLTEAGHAASIGSNGYPPAGASAVSALRGALRALIDDPVVAEALYVASPGLTANIDRWRTDPDTSRGHRAETALVRYFARMCSRATPFGLFAGCSTGSIGSATRLEVGSRSTYYRRTRLDMECVVALIQAAARHPDFRTTMRLWPNSTLYAAAHRLHYVEARRTDKRRTYHLVAVELSAHLQTAIDLAARGATRPELVDALASDTVTMDDADAFVQDLIDTQIIIPEMQPTVTGPDPLERLCAVVSRLEPRTATHAQKLTTIRDALAQLDSGGLGIPRARYDAVAACVAESLPDSVTASGMFQVDLYKPAPEATLGTSVAREALHIVDLLRRLFGVTYRPLDRFCRDFVERYERREVPVTEVLDEDLGIGLPPAEDVSPRRIPGWNTFITGRVLAAASEREREIVLSEASLAPFLATEGLPPLPTSFSTIVSVAAERASDVNEGRFTLVFHGVSGPSAMNLLGRFCHGDDRLAEAVRRHTRAEQAMVGDAIVAELVHLPQDRTGNILIRPVLHDYEVPYACGAGVSPERRIAVSDLTVSVDGDRIRLRSRTLGKDVVPRHTNAHNFRLHENLPLYRFLGLLQAHGTCAGLGWLWGPMSDSPFLPRVRIGRCVVALARWALSADIVEEFCRGALSERFERVHAWRLANHVPRFLYFGEFDSQFIVDLDNVLSVESFISILPNSQHRVLIEAYPDESHLTLTSPEGKFVSEIIIPFLQPAPSVAGHLRTQDMARVAGGPRRFPPTGPWLYAKLYVGHSSGDQVLLEVIAPLVAHLLRADIINAWYFVRYADPHPHIRIRLRGTAPLLQPELVARLHSVFERELDIGRVWRVQFETYERELERYGGGFGIDLAECLFCADSDYALAALAATSSAVEAREMLAIRGIDVLLSDFAYRAETKVALLAKIGSATDERRRLWARRFRLDRSRVEQALSSAFDNVEVLSALAQRTARTATIADQFRSSEADGRMVLPLDTIMPSFLHMHVNRILRGNETAETEPRIYDYVVRYHLGQIEREKAMAMAGSRAIDRS